MPAALANPRGRQHAPGPVSVQVTRSLVRRTSDGERAHFKAGLRERPARLQSHEMGILETHGGVRRGECTDVLHGLKEGDLDIIMPVA